MILTVTLNPSIDKSTFVEKLVPEKKMRCENFKVEAGGCGINVSKAIKELGGESIALFPSGGINGKVLEELMISKGCKLKVIPIAGETRENFTATETFMNAQYRFVFSGPALSNEEITACMQAIEELNPTPEIIIFSGSMPPETPPTVVAEAARLAKQMNAKFIADTSGNTLKQALNEGVYLVKPNLSELCSLVGKEHLELSEIEDAARYLVNKRSTEVIVVSMGPAGALLLNKDICKRIPSPVVKKKSTVGAGDSMVAGMAYMLAKKKLLIEVVQFGVACGTAATMNSGSQLCKKDDVWRLFEWIKMHTA